MLVVNRFDFVLSNLITVRSENSFVRQLSHVLNSATNAHHDHSVLEILVNDDGAAFLFMLLTRWRFLALILLLIQVEVL